MGGAGDVRSSRDGDRYHYYWAARRALCLLDLNSNLRAVWVEGLPDEDQADGDEVVDVAEFDGGDSADTATRALYTQVKHSTKRTGSPIVASELKKTLTKFAQLHREARRREASRSIDFAFVANRELHPAVRLSLAELADGQSSFTHPREADLLRGYLGFGSDTAAEVDFCRRLDIRVGEVGLAELERLLLDDIRQFLPGGGTGSEMAQLLEVVSRCATSLATSQRLMRGDVLHALRTTEEELFPAPSQIIPAGSVIQTADPDAVAHALRTTPDRRFVLTGVGGQGKSILTSQLGQRLPPQSVAIVYDCFAGGDYRKASAGRHHHRTGLTQIANEMAAHGLCVPLIPTVADNAAYVRVFMQRVRVAAAQLATLDSDAVLVIIIDAADNAALAASSLHQQSFVADLFREDWPPGTRLVALCRPERKTLLDLPARGVTELRLAGFRRHDTLEHLRARFPEATPEQGAELHALSSGNPRVQAMALSSALSISEVLGALEIASHRPGQQLDALLEDQVQSVADDGHLTPTELDTLCHALAALHPSIPLRELSHLTGLSTGALRSFAMALGRNFHVTETVLQFRDEPTETWFRNAFHSDADRRAALARAVQARSSTSAYCASVAPQLLLEAGLLDDLVTLALSNEALPSDTDDLQAQEIARSRARFALGATLAVDRRADAARLAIRAGALTSGRARRLALFRAHPDLTARFMGPRFVEDICAKRELAVDWPGSNLHTEATMLSQFSELQDLGRARLRSALGNLASIQRAEASGGARCPTRSVLNAEVAMELAFTASSLDGPAGLVEFLGRLEPGSFARKVARLTCERLADSGSIADVDHLLSAPGLLEVRAGAADTLYSYNVRPSDQATEVFAGELRQRATPIAAETEAHHSGPDPGGLVWMTIHALGRGNLSDSEALRALELHIPTHAPDHIASSWSRQAPLPLLLALALRARMRGDSLDLKLVASRSMADRIAKSTTYSADADVREFQENLEPLLPWVDCWLDFLLTGETSTTRERLRALRPETPTSMAGHNTPYVRLNGTREIATRLLAELHDEDLLAAYGAWEAAAESSTAGSRLAVARIASRSAHLHPLALQIVAHGSAQALRDRTESESRVAALVALARAVLSSNEVEARALYSLALREAELVGDDLHTRWRSLLGTAKSLANCDEPRRALRLFEIAEALDHETTVDVYDVGSRIFAMHLPTFYAKASTARDRRTISFEALVASALDPKLASTAPPERFALVPLVPRCEWRPIADALRSTDKAHVASTLDQYGKCDGQIEAASSTEAAWDEDHASDEQLPDLATRVASLDFTLADSWSAALSVLALHEDPNLLAAIALDRHPVQRPQVLDAFARTPGTTRREWAAVARTASQRPSTPGLQAALREMSSSFARRFAADLASSGYDDGLLDEVAVAAGVSAASLRHLSFREAASVAPDLSYSACFYLASNLAQSLPPAEASAAFDDLAALFDDLAPSAYVDGGTHTSLPPHSVGEPACIASLLWSALGDMSANIRWRAAHCVLLLAQLRSHETLKSLLDRAQSAAAAAGFVDPRFPFYEAHARMWLLVALERAAHDPASESVAAFIPWLVRVVMDEQHSANQVLAQRALRALADAGHTSMAADTKALDVRLSPRFALMDWSARRARANPIEPSDRLPARSWRFFLDYDKWCEELAEVFGTTGADVLGLAQHLAAGIEGYQYVAGRTDPRREAGVYRDGTTYARDWSWPAEETVSFYVAVHALLGAGASLAAKHESYKEPDSPYDAYEDWLARFVPLRGDGRWLSDRRDPPPSPRPDHVLRAAGSHPDWPWTMSSADFENAAGIGEPWFTVYAWLENDEHLLTERVQVESALVPSATAEALVVAMQTLPVGGFNLPTAEEPDDVDQYPFELMPWLDLRSREGGLDRLDERTAGVPFPPARPSDETRSAFHLSHDEDMRLWHSGGRPVFRSQVWAAKHRFTRDRDHGTSGQRLEVDRRFIAQVLRAHNACLVVQVALRRQRTRASGDWREESDDEFDWLDWSRKAYLLDPEGRWLEY